MAGRPQRRARRNNPRVRDIYNRLRERFSAWVTPEYWTPGASQWLWRGAELVAKGARTEADIERAFVEAVEMESTYSERSLEEVLKGYSDTEGLRPGTQAERWGFPSPGSRRRAATARKRRARLNGLPAVVEFVNLTPHRLNILTPSGMVVFDPSGMVTRVATLRREGPTVGGIPTVITSYGRVEDLPRRRKGKVYIVSGMVAAQVPHREDVFSPGPLVRDENGRPVGAEGLSRTSA
jgi:hypothetical protein